MKKFLLIGLVLLGVAAAPREASAACTDSAAQTLLDGHVAPQITLLPQGQVNVSQLATAVSGCNNKALVQLNWTHVCTQGSSSEAINGGTWCTKTQNATTVTAHGGMTTSSGVLPCNQDATVYGTVGRADNNATNWIFGQTKTDSVHRNCNNEYAIYEEDCEEDSSWEWQGNGTCTTLGTPILISTGKDKPGLKDYRMSDVSNGVLFDIDADGIVEQVSWTKKNANVALLAIDRNGNGVIDNGSELFGNHTVAGASNGFKALASLSGESVQVDASNPLFASLLLWTDSNHNGQTDNGELAPLSSLFSTIYVVTVPSTLTDGAGNRFAYIGLIEEAGSRDTRVIYDVILKK